MVIGRRGFRHAAADSTSVLSRCAWESSYRLDDRVGGAGDVHACVPCALGAVRRATGKCNARRLERERCGILTPAKLGHVEPREEARLGATKSHNRQITFE